MRYLLLFLLLLPGCASAAGADSGAPLRIAVAANFRATLQQASELFEQETDLQVVLSSGSSGV
ncbi:MAG: hypothetical protein ACRCVD_09475, partial [Halioglobus sp.]